jgi:hypothetical protein
MVLGVTSDDALTAAAALAVAFVVLAVVAALVVKAAVVRLVSLVIASVLAGLVWSQRASLAECADRVQAEVAADGVDVDTTCTIFGRTVRVNLPGGDEAPTTP